MLIARGVCRPRHSRVSEPTLGPRYGDPGTPNRDTYAMGTVSNAPDMQPSEASLDDVTERLSLVESSLSEWERKRQAFDSESVRQTQRLESVTAENTRLKATCSELEYDLNAAREDVAAAREDSLLLKHDNERLQQSEDRLVAIRAELAETKEQLGSTQRSVVLLEHDIEDLRQRETELLAIRAKYDDLRVEHALVAERHRQAARRLDDRERDLERCHQRVAKLESEVVSSVSGLSDVEKRAATERDDARVQLERLRDESREKLESLEREKTRLRDDSREKLEVLEREKTRLSEAIVQLRAQSTRLRKTYDMARSQSNELDALVAQLADGLELMVRSRRWRLGNLLLSFPRRMIFRGTPPMVTDTMLGLVRQYREDRRTSSRQWRRLAEPTEAGKAGGN